MKLAEKIQSDLKRFDLVLLIIDGTGIAENLTIDFCYSQPLRRTSKKILILSQTENFYQKGWSDGYCLKNEFRQKGDIQGNSEYRQISSKEQKELSDLYRMYEFSDHFQVLADCPQFGGLLNYVKTGLLSKEEVFELILKKV